MNSLASRVEPAVDPSPALPRDGSDLFASDDARYDAVRARDARADGRFFYAVATTGVYCRPSCAARLALRENVSFHATADAAERAGYRACKRCRPRDLAQHERHARLVDKARRLLDASDTPVALAELATLLGVSPFHLHRLFKQHLGLTPRAYSSARRLQRVGDELRGGASVTEAIHGAGYSSSSRFYEASSGALGVAPRELRRGAPGVEMRALVTECSLGRVLVAATARGVCAIAFGDAPEALREELRARFPRATVQEPDAALSDLAARVVAMIDAEARGADLPLDLLGTAFQQRVWRELRSIPRGETLTYAEVARRIGAPRAVRAVGTACGKNPVAVAVPCHRVLREDGSLGGYRWGIERKAQLLKRERGT